MNKKVKSPVKVEKLFDSFCLERKISQCHADEIKEILYEYIHAHEAIHQATNGYKVCLCNEDKHCDAKGWNDAISYIRSILKPPKVKIYKPKSEEWFMARIGKRVFRDNCECCPACKRIAEEGLIVRNKIMSKHLAAVDNDYAAEGIYLNYRDEK